MKIHHNDAYPELKPKDKRISVKEIRKKRTLQKIEEIKANEEDLENYCIIC